MNRLFPWVILLRNIASFYILRVVKFGPLMVCFICSVMLNLLAACRGKNLHKVGLNLHFMEYR